MSKTPLEIVDGALAILSGPERFASANWLADRDDQPFSFYGASAHSRGWGYRVCTLGALNLSAQGLLPEEASLHDAMNGYGSARERVYRLLRDLPEAGDSIILGLNLKGYDAVVAALTKVRDRLTGLTTVTMRDYELRAIIAPRLRRHRTSDVLAIYDVIEPGATFVLGAMTWNEEAGFYRTSTDPDATLFCPAVTADLPRGSAPGLGGLIDASVGKYIDGDLYRVGTKWRLVVT